MAHISLALYRTVARIAHRVPLPTKKLAASVAGRRGAARRWVSWARSSRRPGPVVWVHGASVGEMLTAEPVISRLRRDRSELQVIHTFTSPSVARWRMPGVAASDYLPLDEPGPVGAVLDAIRPQTLVFSRGDVWPELLALAHARGIPALVLGASVRRESRRLSWPARALYRSNYAMLGWIGAASEGDAARWIALGAPAERVEVTGDPRHAQTLERVPELGRIVPVAVWASRGRALVAGSTHPRDDALLLEAALRVFSERPASRLLIVPHEPDRAAVERIVAGASRRGISAAGWVPGSSIPECRCLVVQAVGLLFELYALGQLAYVGGGFQRGRVHAVIEPAAWGLPIISGPCAADSEDARALARTGGLTILPRTAQADALVARWLSWLGDDTERVAAGLRGRALLSSRAAVRTAEVLRGFLSDR